MSKIESDLIDVLDSIDEYISSFNKDWIILYISKKTANDFGYKQSDLTGKNFWQLFPKFIGTELEKNYCTVMDKRVTIKFEWRTIYAKDSVREFTVSPSVHGITVYGIDITQRKKAEEALKESERLYKTIFENSEDGFMQVEIVYDNNGKPIDQKYLKINQAFCKQTGIKEENIIGKTMRQVLPNVEQSWFDIPDRVLKTRKPIHTENYNQDTDRFYDLYCFPLSEKTVGSLFRDITQRKNLEKQLKEKERLAAIGQTAGMVGHDIRNPLQAIAGDIYLLKDFLIQMPENNPTKAEVVESLDSIEQNISYINKIVADLQDYARAVKLELSEFNLCELVTTVITPIAIPDNIQVSIDLDSTCRIRSDPTLLRRIINNLIVNALQAMPEGGRLCVTGYRSGERFLIIVKDTGVGIPEHIKPKLFMPMMTTKSKGQGLGLAVVKRLVEALEGTISFESQEGKGTTFKIELPINN